VLGLDKSIYFQFIRSDGKNQVIVYSPQYGVYYSGDNGITWKLQNSSFTNKSLNQLNYSYFGGLFGTADHVIYYSPDNGVTWNILPYANSSQLISLQEGPGNQLYVSDRSRGIFRSTDNGASWKQLRNVNGGYDFDGGDYFYIDPASGWLYKTANTPSTMYVSKDGGNKYSSLAIMGVDAYSYAINNGVLYFAGGDGYIYKIDGANNFSEIASIRQNQPPDGIFVVSNNGYVVFREELNLFSQYIKP